MITTVLAVLGFAFLFALAGFLRRGPGCGSDCGSCGAACKLLETNDDHA